MDKNLSTSTIGKQGEEIASLFLIEKGYEIVDKNYRFKKGEIDIVAKVDNLIVFVEVKKRKTPKFGYPEDFVNPQKANLVRLTAVHYIEAHNLHWNIRFDIISIIGEDIEHFEDAF